jgi:Tfp pilus assembly PilM family ATPase
MVEKTELSITHKTSDELEKTLRQAMQRYLNKSDEKVIEGVVLSV